MRLAALMLLVNSVSCEAPGTASAAFGVVVVVVVVELVAGGSSELGDATMDLMITMVTTTNTMAMIHGRADFRSDEAEALLAV
jgi:hypothetical protein